MMKVQLIQLAAVFAVITSLAARPRAVAAEPTGPIEFFETHVRPVLYEHCLECHGAQTQWNEFRVDSRRALLEGGDQGAAIVPHSAESSLLVQAIRRKGELQMPPDEPLTETQIQAIERWINEGAVWPVEVAPAEVDDENRRKHWAFQPIEAPAIPEVTDSDWMTNAVDAFVLTRLREADLRPAPEADRRTLVRRLYFDLTGLPPTYEDVRRWEQSTDPGWYGELVEQLLVSPEYGERWGRFWLDIARYSDTKGYVYAREEKNYVHAHAYRDWVVHAFRRDLPFDQFVMYQIAADQLTETGSADRAAMGYLTLGRRFLGVSHDIIDDRIDVVTRGLMGLTVSCARCHDHKYDPIPTREYYSLYGVFLNSTEQIERLPGLPEEPTDSAWEAELAKRQQAYDDAANKARQTASDRMRERILEYFIAQSELEKYPQEGFGTILSPKDLVPDLVRRLQLYLVDKCSTDDRRFIAWKEFAAIDDKQFEEQSRAVWNDFQQESQRLHPRVAALFPEPPQSFRQVAERYGQLFADVYQESLQEQRDEKTATDSEHEIAHADEDELRQVLFGDDAVCEIPNELMYSIENLFDSGTCTELWRLQGEIDRWILQPGVEHRFAVTLRDRKQSYPAQVFRRGNPAQRSGVIPRTMLSIATAKEYPLDDGSGRLQLAKAIVSPENPLTARVWVNRIWKEHFGEGLVRTPSDFGLRAEPPSHPQLLDWLANEFVESGWSTRSLHRLIVHSSTYKQAGSGSQDPVVRHAGETLDPENRLLWHRSPRRLTFEAMRDSLLCLSNSLSQTKGGRAVPMFTISEQGAPRTLYGFVDRQFVPNVLRMFDFANPDLHAPGRSETVVPQQALFSLNHEFAATCATNLARLLEQRGLDDSSPIESRAAYLFERVFQRSPTESELRALISFVESASEPEPTPMSPASLAWSYGYGPIKITNAAKAESAEIPATPQATLESFTPLPHFTGTAWQGGSRFPDRALGWLQLTATGGHPGNTLQHAVVRRWTAPRQMCVRIHSLVEHQEAAGDGIRCWVMRNGNQTLATSEAHQSNWKWATEKLDVNAGDTLEFVVDIREQLNTDQYLWQVTITDQTRSETATHRGPSVREWNSRNDFLGPPTMKLDVWEQLAQVLLISNEATFID